MKLEAIKQVDNLGQSYINNKKIIDDKQRLLDKKIDMLQDLQTQSHTLVSDIKSSRYYKLMISKQ